MHNDGSAGAKNLKCRWFAAESNARPWLDLELQKAAARRNTQNNFRFLADPAEWCIRLVSLHRAKAFPPVNSRVLAGDIHVLIFPKAFGRELVRALPGAKPNEVLAAKV